MEIPSSSTNNKLSSPPAHLPFPHKSTIKFTPTVLTQEIPMQKPDPAADATLIKKLDAQAAKFEQSALHWQEKVFGSIFSRFQKNGNLKKYHSVWD